MRLSSSPLLWLKARTSFTIRARAAQPGTRVSLVCPVPFAPPTSRLGPILPRRNRPMQLWTEYEGVTIDGVFPLKKLLLPEGRSAFFSTANGKGEPAVMRLVECHFDEEEILTRWRSVDALGHPNFLKIERYGQLALDDRPRGLCRIRTRRRQLGRIGRSQPVDRSRSRAARIQPCFRP